MSLIDYMTRKTPDYYPSVYLDGYSPQEILFAARRSMLNRIEESRQVDVIRIISEVKVK